MKIVIERTGGFAGFKRRYEVDIDPTQLDALESFVADDANSADRFSYKIIVGSGPGERSFVVPEEALLKITGKLL